MKVRATLMLLVWMACHAFSQVSPSDSTVIQKILDDNGVDGTSVSDVVITTDSNGNVLILELSNLELTTLSNEIGQLSKLTGLGLKENNLSTLPPQIGSIPNLEHLILRGNTLTSLPPEIMGLEELFVCPENDFCIGDAGLDIRDNRLCNLPDSMENWLDTNWTHFRTWDWREFQDCTIGVFDEIRIQKMANPEYLLRRGTVYYRGKGRILNLKGQKKELLR